MAAQNALNLKPRTIVELFDQAFRLYRNNFIKFVGIVAVALVPIQVIELVLNALTYQKGVVDLNTDLVGVYAASFISLLLQFIFVSGVATAALTSAITSSYLGEKITIASAYSKIRGSWGRLLGALLLLGLVIIIALLWTIIPCAGWLTGIGIVTFITLTVSPLVAPIIVVENLSGMKAVRRAWELARRRFWWLIGYFVLIFLFNLLVIEGPVQLIASAIQNYVSTTIASTQLISSVVLQLMANSILTLLLSLIYIPLQSTCATLVYFDLRIRQEGFDLAMMANQTSESPVNAVDLAGQTSGTAVGSLVAWKEMGFFALISVAIMAFYFLIIIILAGGQILAGL